MEGRLVIVHWSNFLINKQMQLQLVHFYDFCFELSEWKWVRSVALQVTAFASYSNSFRMVFVSHFLLHGVVKQRLKSDIVIVNRIMFILHCNAQARSFG